MTRDKYLSLLKEKNFTYIMYMYYKDRTGVLISTDVFSELITEYLNAIAIRYLLDCNSLIDKCKEIAREYFNDKFQINKIIMDEQICNYY